jgi:L-iditol 2-dehydrogenase
MQAAVLYGPGDLRVQEVAEPKLCEGYALVSVQACGVCPSDIRRFFGGDSFEPWTPGHEVSGLVAGIAGRPAAGLAVGDRVVADWRVVCGRCFYCLNGNPNFCTHREEFAIAGFAEYTAVPQAALRKLPPAMTFAEASFCEPLACVLNAHLALPAWPALDLVVVGAGPIGLLHVQVAAQRGVRVIAVDPLSQRRAVALELGANEAVDPSDGDVVAQVRDLTGGHGATSVIVAVGSLSVAEQAIAMTRKGGTVCFFAGFYPPGELRIDPNLIHYSEISLTGSHNYGPAEFAAALRMLEQGIVRAGPLATHRFPLSQIATAFETARDQRGLKSIIQPDDTEAAK